MSGDRVGPCYCGHARASHLQGDGLCLTCRGRMCLIFRQFTPLIETDADTAGETQVGVIT